MTTYYAPGGGLGHATRARRVLDRLGIDAAIITSAELPRELEGDAEAHRRWLLERVDDHLLVDTFPAGIQGELAGVELPHIDHVARLLRWNDYPHRDAPRFRTTYAVEPLTAEHEAYLRERSERFVELDLALDTVAAAPVAGRWLIVHSGPAEEVRELVAYASELAAIRQNLEILVATRCDVDLPPGFTRIDALPATHLYPTAETIITAAGFNVMLETEPYRERHHALPFPRRFDDQFLRAARRRTATARIG